jgi:hypothetical protein
VKTDAWSPWKKKDPATKGNYGAATADKGATYTWDGNKDVGHGWLVLGLEARIGRSRKAICEGRCADILDRNGWL